MSNHLENITHLSKQYSKEIKTLTKILLDKFGITYFALQHVSSRGEWSILGNNPDWLDFSAENGYYQVDPSLIQPEYTQNTWKC